MRLYKVTLTGMINSVSGVSYGESYVIAEDPNEAYLKVRSFLNENNIGLKVHRELKSIELLADEYQYNHTGTMIFT